MANTLRNSLILVFFLGTFLTQAQEKEHQLESPDRSITVMFKIKNDGTLFYRISKNNKQVLGPSRLGVIREDGDFSRALKLKAVTKITLVKDVYVLNNAKRSKNVYLANAQTFRLLNSQGKDFELIFRVSNDGMAFHYHFPGKSTDQKKIIEEKTSFKFFEDTKGWLQPMSIAQTGWEHSNPSYEENYKQGIPVGQPSPLKAGWVYPALFQTGNNWIVLTETVAEGGNYCGTRLKAESPEGEYSIGFPASQERFSKEAALFPQSLLPWFSPWRIIGIGSLKTIMESTLGTDLAEPAIKMDTSFIKPGKASWSWVLLKDDSTVYTVQKRFIDYAANMHWKYCLIDADWDKKIGYNKIADLSKYAESKKIGLILWYNSAGSWNTTPYSPRNVLLTQEGRKEEFQCLQEMGIKGVKVDFFGGDGQSFMQYYQDILSDAADHNLLVNFHGATLPRGLQRTFPNLMTMEAIKGMEFRTFAQETENIQPVHCTTIPFTRNIFDPMDYTPMVLYKIPNIKRSTTSCFELALPIVFLSGIQHFAETPKGMSHVPLFVKKFLQTLPDHWDDVHFIDGFPGKKVVIARRVGKKWFVAGLNGENKDQLWTLDLSFINANGKLIADGKEALSFSYSKIKASRATSINVKAHGGFVIEFD